MIGIKADKIKKTLLMIAIAILTLGLALPALALEIREFKPETAPAAQPAPKPTTPKLAVEFAPNKAVYKVEEAIKFKVTANKDCYLYIFGINEAAKMAYVLLPNKLETDNQIKAGDSMVIPGDKIEFYGDKPGVEKIVYVASTKKIDLNTGQYEKSGTFMTTTPEIMTKDLKSIRMRPVEDAEQVANEMTLTVVGQAAQAQPKPKAEAAAFVSSDKTEYKLGDPVKILFGADKKGWIYLYTMEPDGKKVFLKKQAIDGERFYRIKAEAATPQGKHKLIAVYSKDGKVDQTKAGASVSGLQEKGLVLVEDKPLPYAVYPFTITK